MGEDKVEIRSWGGRLFHIMKNKCKGMAETLMQIVSFLLNNQAPLKIKSNRSMYWLDKSF